MTSWSDHPLCGPRDTMPSAFWGPEKLDSAAFVELTDVWEIARDFAEKIDRAFDEASRGAMVGTLE